MDTRPLVTFTTAPRDPIFCTQNIQKPGPHTAKTRDGHIISNHQLWDLATEVKPTLTPRQVQDGSGTLGDSCWPSPMMSSVLASGVQMPVRGLLYLSGDVLVAAQNAFHSSSSGDKGRHQPGRHLLCESCRA